MIGKHIQLELGSVSLLHIVLEAHAKFTTGLDAYVSHPEIPLHNQQDITPVEFRV